MPLRRLAIRPAKAGSSVPIKRVLRRGTLFTCGVCRKDHGREAQAEACLARCLDQWLASAAAVASDASTGGEAKRFRCGICRRVYGVRTEAQACSAACRAKTVQVVEQEREAFGVPVQAAAGAEPSRPVARTPSRPAPQAPAKAKAVVRRDQGHKFLRDGRKLVCRKCGKEYATLDDVIGCYDADVIRIEAEKKAPKPVAAAPAPKPITAAVPPAEPTPAPTATAVTSGKPATDHSDDHKFVRDNAKYKCRNCGAKFFTKSDVVACFDQH